VRQDPAHTTDADDDVDFDAFLGRIREALDARRMTQADLARRLGVRDATVTEWFTRGRIPNGMAMLRLPRVLGVRTEWLFHGDGDGIDGVAGGPAASGQVQDVIVELRRVLHNLEERLADEPRP
jgi:HTH-type transcriptional regulator, cell division transcriptional repressor